MPRYWRFAVYSWKRRADNVFVRFYFASLKAVITVHAVEIFHCAIRFIWKISKEVPYVTFSISLIFTQLCTNTFSFDAAIFHLSINGYAEHAGIVITAFFNVQASL